MSNTYGRGARLVILLSAAALLGAACGGDSNAGSGGDGGEELSGSISISGSSTVEPISAANAEKFIGMHPDVQVSVDGPGTGDGFELFCQGDTDISDASRPIDVEEEVPLCEKNGIDFIELKVGIDGLSVITAADNTAVECLSFQDLYALLGPESEGFDKWSDANQLGTDVGGSGDYPDADLVVTAPGQESGTYDSFAELVMEDIAVEERKQPEDGPFIRSDYQSSGDDSVIIEGISGNETSLGWVGYAFFANNSDIVRAIPIEASEGDGCVEPNDETISSGEYPIARDLYIYVNAKNLEENPALEEYVNLYMSDEGFASVGEAGYVDLADEDKQATIDTWEARTTGTQEG